MNHPTKEELRVLVRGSSPPCLSLYAQSFAGSSRNHQNALTVKGLLRKAEVLLEETGMGAKKINNFLDPVRRWEGKQNPDQPSANAVAMFLSGTELHHYPVSLPFGESVTVGSCFHLRPLLTGLLREGLFYVLAVSRNHVRLFQGNREQLRRVDVADFPNGLAYALKEDDEEVLNVRSAGPARLGKRALITYGNGAGSGESKKEGLRKYFRIIDKSLHGLLREERAPVVLAGVGYYFPLYKEANTYPHLLQDGIAGSPDRLGEKEIHSAAWKIVERHLMRRLEQALVHYGRLRRAGRCRSAIDEVVRAAHEGRVEVLFLTSTNRQWGTYDVTVRQTRVHEERHPLDDDLLDLVVAQTLSHKGEVFVVEKDRIPEGGIVAAGLRY